MPTLRLPLKTGVLLQGVVRAFTGASVRWALCATLLLCATTQARADYRLHVGDVIEISVARAPELKQRVPVQLDGSISFPMLGYLRVVGLTPAEAQSRFRRSWPQRYCVSGHRTGAIARS